MTRYSERLVVPATWYVVAAGLVVSVFVALIFVAGPLPAILATVLALAVVGWVFARSSLLVKVDEHGVLQVGRATLEPRWRGRVRSLDAAETRNRLGVGADARAWLAMRGYIDTAVEIVVDDPADPHPYWLVSTRRPRRLAAALGGMSSAEERQDVQLGLRESDAQRDRQTEEEAR